MVKINDYSYLRKLMTYRKDFKSWWNMTKGLDTYYKDRLNKLLWLKPELIFKNYQVRIIFWKKYKKVES